MKSKSTLSYLVPSHMKMVGVHLLRSQLAADVLKHLF
jgi:hypothetical protein